MTKKEALEVHGENNYSYCRTCGIRRDLGELEDSSFTMFTRDHMYSDYIFNDHFDDLVKMAYSYALGLSETQDRQAYISLAGQLAELKKQFEGFFPETPDE